MLIVSGTCSSQTRHGDVQVFDRPINVFQVRQGFETTSTCSCSGLGGPNWSETQRFLGLETLSISTWESKFEKKKQLEGKLVKGPYKPIHRNYAIYFLLTVIVFKSKGGWNNLMRLLLKWDHFDPFWSNLLKEWGYCLEARGHKTARWRRLVHGVQPVHSPNLLGSFLETSPQNEKRTIDWWNRPK